MAQTADRRMTLVNGDFRSPARSGLAASRLGRFARTVAIRGDLATSGRQREAAWPLRGSAASRGRSPSVATWRLPVASAKRLSRFVARPLRAAVAIRGDLGEDPCHALRGDPV